MTTAKGLFLYGSSGGASGNGGGGGGSFVGPTPTSLAAVNATIANNNLCRTATAGMGPFYWEIGDVNGPLASGSLGVANGIPGLANGNPILRTTRLSIASATKWLYSTYVVETRGSPAAITANDVFHLTFVSGYTYMTIGGTACSPATTFPTVNICLTQTDGSGDPWTSQDPTTTGLFFYGSGHMENHASKYMGIGTSDRTILGPLISGVISPNSNFVYTQPLMAGGVYCCAADSALWLQRILKGNLVMSQVLGANAVPAFGAGTSSPIPENWHYSLGHWVEDDPATHGDGTFTAIGSFGYYTWIDKTKTYYGIISCYGAAGHGYTELQGGRLIRVAWMTGNEQTGTIPQAY